MNKLKKQKDVNIKKQISIFNNLSLLLSKSFIKEPKSIIFMLIVPIFFNIMFFFIMGEKAAIGGNGNPNSILFAYTLLPCLTCLTLLAPAVVEWKNSVFLKRIDITGIRKGMFIGALWFVYLIAGIISFILMMIFNLIFSEIYSLALNKNDPTFAKLLGGVHWGYLLLSMILITLTSIALATMFGGLFSSVGSMQGMIMMIYFFSIFLSGIMLPPETFESSKGMIIFTYFIPHKYSVFIFLYATRGWSDKGWDSGFNLHDGSKDFTATWQPVLGAILILIAIFTITTLTFKWTAKK
ncbi:ABC transporter permease [Spiroplasma cantharicola]|uniref:ABC transporter permease protein n=1 Tax=Spiroplasma cantharicola TaxID=362837 RepID=A0A0M4JWV4_9MOLU|nr:ABC transporter permease [Spiroplasma cantharicola]ALD66492.1 ABC transporter permease protein [Spiroplasma cantharicola]